jgi:membrane protease YdiL (CAAX protease family)
MLHNVKKRKAEWEAENRAAQKNIGELITFAAFFGSMLFLGIVVFTGMFEEDRLHGQGMTAPDFLIIAGMHVWLLFWALFFTKIFKNTFKQIGFGVPSRIVDIAIGVLAGTLLYFALSGVQFLLLRIFPSTFLELEDTLIPGSGFYIGLAVLISFTAGVSEEVLYRGYANMVIFKYTGSRLLCISVLSLAFGATHLYQGLTGVIVTTLFALAMHGVFYFRFSLLGAITAHIVYDLFATLTQRVW